MVIPPEMIRIIPTHLILTMVPHTTDTSVEAIKSCHVVAVAIMMANNLCIPFMKNLQDIILFSFSSLINLLIILPS